MVIVGLQWATGVILPCAGASVGATPAPTPAPSPGPRWIAARWGYLVFRVGRVQRREDALHIVQRYARLDAVEGFQADRAGPGSRPAGPR